MESFKCHTAITFLPAQLTSVKLTAAFPSFSHSPVLSSSNLKAMSSSATHFTLWNGVKVRVQRLKRSSFHTPTPALASQSNTTGAGCLWNNLTASCLQGKTFVRKKNTPLIVPCSVPMTGQNTPCYCIFAQYFSSHNGWQRGWCEFTVPPLWQ